MGNSISRKLISMGILIVGGCVTLLITPIIVSISFCSWFIVKAKNKMGL